MDIWAWMVTLRGEKERRELLPPSLHGPLCPQLCTGASGRPAGWGGGRWARRGELAARLCAQEATPSANDHLLREWLCAAVQLFAEGALFSIINKGYYLRGLMSGGQELGLWREPPRLESQLNTL